MLQGLPDSAPEVVKFGWMMLHVREVKVPYSIVGTMDGALITAATVKMHRRYAQEVRRTGQSINKTHIMVILCEFRLV